MSQISVDPNLVPLLQGLKPYLSVKSQALADGISSFLQLLTSQHGKEAVSTMSKVFSTPGGSSKSVTINTVAGPVTFSFGLAFALFLILILLVLSGNLLALNPGGFGDAGRQQEQPSGAMV